MKETDHSPAVSCSTALLLIFYCLRKPIAAFMFEKLDVYQKAIDFADQAASLTKIPGTAKPAMASPVPLPTAK